MRSSFSVKTFPAPTISRNFASVSCPNAIKNSAPRMFAGTQRGQAKYVKLAPAVRVESVCQTTSRFVRFRLMKKINLSAVPVEERKSPKGRYRRFDQDISAALRQ